MLLTLWYGAESMNSVGCQDSYLEKSIPVSEDNADDGGNNDDNGEDSSIFPGPCPRRA